MRSDRLKHLPALDGIRALAILPVLVTHLWTYPRSTPLLNRYAAAGWVGVDLFFVLSGFLITRGLLATQGRADYARHFYGRRIRRIVPAYYLLLVVVFGLLPFVSHDPNLLHARHDWLWYATYLSNVHFARVGWQVFLLDVTWSLAVEEQFYLVWPWVVRWCSRERLAAVAVTLLLVTPCVRWACLAAGCLSPAWLDLVTPFRADSLAAGALLAALEPSLRRVPRGVTIVAAVLAAGLLVAIGTGHFARTGAGTLLWGHTALAVVAAVLIWHGITAHDSRLAWAPARAIGRVSYGLYLYHPVTLAVVGTLAARAGVTLHGVLQLVVVSAASYVVAVLSFRYVETPILHAGRAQRSVAWATTGTPPHLAAPAP